MKKYLLISFTFFLLNCSSDTKKDIRQETNVPTALQDNKETKVLSYSKRGPDDLVDELYAEKLEAAAGLRALERKFNDLSKDKIDSLDVFHDFDSKNQQYYTSTNDHLNRVQDSFIRQELKTVFENNNNTYKRSISQLKALEEHLDKQFVSTLDRRLALKLFVTLNMMDEFKKTNQPGLSTLENILNSFKALNRQLDSAIAKNK